MMIVTGATGFIGRRVVRLLLEAGHEVRSIGRAEGASGSEFRSVDLLTGDLSFALDGAEGATMLHLAWYTRPASFWTAPENLEWAEASLRLARQFSKHGGKRLIVAGTCAEYGWGGSPLEETASPLEPATLYGAAKAGLYLTLCKAAPVLGFELAWARIFNPYGPDEAAQRLLGNLLAAARGEAAASFSAGLQRRDFMHVDDVAGAIVALALSDVVGAVNIASGDARRVREFVEIAGHAAGIGHRLIFGDRPLAEQDVAVVSASIRRLSDEVGFRPTFGFEDGIADAVRRGLQPAKAKS